MSDADDDDIGTFTDLFRRAFASGLRDVYVALPARVESYDSATQKCSVQPLIKDVYEAEDGERIVKRYPVIEGVPVLFPGAGGWSLTGPLQPGDGVWLNFSTRSLEQLLESGDEGDPEDDRRQHYKDAVAITGFRDFRHPIASDGVDAAAVVLKAPEIKLGGSDASDPVIRKSDLDRLKTAFNNWVVVAMDGGAALKTALSNAFGGAALPTWPAGSPVTKTK